LFHFFNGILVPGKPPKGIEATFTKSSITLIWNSLNGTDDANGPITYYMIYTTYIKKKYPADIGKRITESNICFSNTFVLDNLRPYWNYSVRISAFTTAGEGHPSEEQIYTTNESSKFDCRLL
jgi:hypothetical protein